MQRDILLSHFKLFYWSCLRTLLELLVDLVPFSVLRAGSAGLREELHEQSAKPAARKRQSYE